MNNIINLTILLLFLTQLLNTGFSQDFDEYGGFKTNYEGKEEYDYFKVKKINGRHCLITPEGNPFIAIGLNHFHDSNIIKKFKNNATVTDSIINDLKQLGFNAGCYQGPEWMANKIPYTKGINILPNRPYEKPKDFTFKDVFEGNVMVEVKNKIQETIYKTFKNNEGNVVYVLDDNGEKIHKYKDDQYFIGYFFTDIPLWTKEYNKNFTERVNRKKSWISFYEDLAENNPHTNGGNVWLKWKSENPEKDEMKFLGEIAEQLYSVSANAVVETYGGKDEPRHLIFGERLWEKDWSHEVAKAAANIFDAISIQPDNIYRPKFYEYYSENFDTAVYLADHVSSFANHGEYDNLPSNTYSSNTVAQIAACEDDYKPKYKEIVDAYMSLPFVVGMNRCQYVSTNIKNHKNNDYTLKQGIIKQSWESNLVDGDQYDFAGDILKDLFDANLKREYGLIDGKYTYTNDDSEYFLETNENITLNVEDVDEGYYNILFHYTCDTSIGSKIFLDSKKIGQLSFPFTGSSNIAEKSIYIPNGSSNILIEKFWGNGGVTISKIQLKEETKLQQLITNPGAESGLKEDWFKWSKDVHFSISTEAAETGDYGFKCSERSKHSDSIRQKVTTGLALNGQRKYSLSSSVRINDFADPETVVKLVLITNGDNVFIADEQKINGNSFVNLSGEIDVAWNEPLSNAVIYVSTGNSQEIPTDVYSDNYSLIPSLPENNAECSNHTH